MEQTLDLRYEHSQLFTIELWLITVTTITTIYWVPTLYQVLYCTNRTSFSLHNKRYFLKFTKKRKLKLIDAFQRLD